MSVHVTFQMFIMGKAWPTRVTLIWFLPSMNAKMILQSSTLSKAWPACDVAHSYGFSPVWIHMCLFKFPHWAKNSPQVSHLKAFSPVWVHRCLFKVPISAKHNPHVSHLNGFSPVWVRMCLFSWPFWAKNIPRFTFKRFLSSRSAQVLLQTYTPSKE